MYEEYSDLTDEYRNENKELDRELVSVDTYIPAEVGKTILVMKFKLDLFVCSYRVSNRNGLVGCRK